jgi:hypothetical protein
VNEEIAERPRWTHKLIVLAVAAMTLVLLAGGAAMIIGHPIPLSTVLSIFLLSFAVLKFSVATDAVIRLRTGATPSPIETHGSLAMARAWIGYKYAACAVATGAAIYLFTSASDKIDGLMK